MFNFIRSFYTSVRCDQRGALFGMDARIALIVASVLLATGGVTIMSRLNQAKVLQTEEALVKLRSGLETYYKTISITELPQSVADLFTEGLMNDLSLKTDTWNRSWYYSTHTANVTLEGTAITMHYATLHSAGKDGIDNSGSITSEGDYAAWEPLGDDIGIKFSTRDVETARLGEYRARGQLITDKLSTYESAAYLQATGACESSTPESFCENIDTKNYTQLNYYPKSDLDENADVKYYSDISGNTTMLTAGDMTDMESLMELIGLPTSYAQDPWGRVLFYHSNITDKSDPPFTASICFSDGGSCF